MSFINPAFNFTYQIVDGSVLHAVGGSAGSGGVNVFGNSTISGVSRGTMTDASWSGKWQEGQWAGGLLSVWPGFRGGTSTKTAASQTVKILTSGIVGNIITVNPWIPVPPASSIYILQGAFIYKGALRGVLNEPTFTAQINQGYGSLTLDIDHFPSELDFGDLVQVQYPDGGLAGYWKYEQRVSKLDKENSYKLTLLPLVSELNDIDYTENWSTDTSQTTAALGNISFAIPVVGSMLPSWHCLFGTINDTGIPYAYTYSHATSKQTLDQGVLFGSTPSVGAATSGPTPGWWWFCDRLGYVSITNVSPVQHEVTVGREIALGEWDDNILALSNGQWVSGGTPTGETDIAVASNLVALPTGTINVVSTNDFSSIPSASAILIPGGAQAFPSPSAQISVTPTRQVNITTHSNTNITGSGVFSSADIGAAITGAQPPMPSGAIITAVASSSSATMNLPATSSTTITATINSGPQIITYTGLTATSFTGCTGGTGVLDTGNLVTALALQAFYQDTSIANPWSTANIGIRTAPAYSDDSLLDLLSVQTVAYNLVALNERVTARRKLTLYNYNNNSSFVRAPQPGDAMVIRQPNPDPISRENMVVGGPYLILEVTEYGATGKYEVTIAADMIAATGALRPDLAPTVAMQKLIQNH